MVGCWLTEDTTAGDDWPTISWVLPLPSKQQSSLLETQLLLWGGTADPTWEWNLCTDQPVFQIQGQTLPQPLLSQQSCMRRIFCNYALGSACTEQQATSWQE